MRLQDCLTKKKKTPRLQRKHPSTNIEFMDKFKSFQILKLLAIAAFLIITPLLSTSLRPAYIYFVLNLLIIALGAEAGLLSFIFKTAEEKKAAAGGSVPQNSKPAAANLAVTVTEKPRMASEAAKTDEKLEEVGNSIVKEMASASDHAKPKANKVVQKCSSEKVNVGSLKHRVVKKCPSTPSLFFIGGGETEQPEEFVEDDDDDDQELFHKAETFIGNFYTQLKMQREDSWKKLQEIYQKAF